jgi:hypothetical protein
VLTNPTPEQAINFLLSGRGIRLFWNLDFATAKLIKLLDWPVSAGRKLWENKKVYDSQSNYTLGYYPASRCP